MARSPHQVLAVRGHGRHRALRIGSCFWGMSTKSSQSWTKPGFQSSPTWRHRRGRATWHGSRLQGPVRPQREAFAGPGPIRHAIEAKPRPPVRSDGYACFRKAAFQRPSPVRAPMWWRRSGWPRASRPSSLEQAGDALPKPREWRSPARRQCPAGLGCRPVRSVPRCEAAPVSGGRRRSGRLPTAPASTRLPGPLAGRGATSSAGHRSAAQKRHLPSHFARRCFVHGGPLDYGMISYVRHDLIGSISVGQGDRRTAVAMPRARTCASLQAARLGSSVMRPRSAICKSRKPPIGCLPEHENHGLALRRRPARSRR